MFHRGTPLKDVQIDERDSKVRKHEMLYQDNGDWKDDRGVTSYGTDGRTMLKAGSVIMRTRRREIY
jgi:hypothetical protein